MAYIKVNDIFDELIDENKKLNQCLSVLIRFKTFFDSVYNNLKTDLDLNTIQIFDGLHKEVDKCFETNDIKIHCKTEYNLFDPNLMTYSKQETHSFIRKKCETVGQNPNKRKPQKRGPKPAIKKEETQGYICTFVGCGKILQTRSGLTQHLRRHSADGLRYKCDFNGGCGYSTDKKIECIDHINAHKGIKAYLCDICHNRFATQTSLKGHKLLIHTESDHILICELENCNKGFKSELSLKNHQKFMHLMEKSFVCNETDCNYRTISAAHLRQHHKMVHMTERPFKCQVNGCNKSFRVNSQLNEHILTHSSERKFKCPFDGCNKAFFSQKILHKHTYIHSPSRFRCDWPGCDYTTSVSVYLKHHRKSHSCERRFQCHWPLCGKTFKQSTHLQTHLRIHKSDKKYACSWPGCLYRCTDSGNIQKHMKVHRK